MKQKKYCKAKVNKGKVEKRAHKRTKRLEIKK